MFKAVSFCIVIFSTSVFAYQTNEISTQSCLTDECSKHFKQVRYLAKRGYSDAEGILASMYLNGYGVEKNNDKGIKWLKKSADAGNVYYRSALGMMYLTGELLVQDLHKSLELLMGKDYINQSGEGSHNNALQYLEAKSMRGDERATYLLGTYLQTHNANQISTERKEQLIAVVNQQTTLANSTMMNQEQTAIDNVIIENDDMEVVKVSSPTLQFLVQDAVDTMKEKHRQKQHNHRLYNVNRNWAVGYYANMRSSMVGGALWPLNQ